MKISQQIAPSFIRTFNSYKMHQIYKGGRGSTKTSMIALKIVFNCLKEDNCSVVVLRKHQNQLRKSVYKEIKRACKRLGLVEKVHYTATTSPMEIKFIDNGNTIYFAGGDDFETVKGTIDEDKLIKIVWFEEATGWDNGEDIDQIIATFTRGNNDWFMALYSFNPPKNKFSWINKWCEEMSKRDDVLVSSTDYRTVPIEWLGQMFIDEAERMKQYDPKRYRWIYLGEVIGMEGMIYNPEQFEFVEEDYIEKNKIRILYNDFATDGGHQTSATTCGCFGYGSDGYWYWLDTYYYSPHEKSRKKAPSELSKDLFNFEIAMLKQWKCGIDKETIDSAEGALRNQIYADYGKVFHPVNKGKDKEELIDYSINFLSKGKLRVINNNNNKIVKKEIENYQWQEGSIEKGKPIPDKSEKEFTGGEEYYNTWSKDQSYYYAEHTCDLFQYWVKDNLIKLGLKE
ncbi:MAG: PBSX family phage terminase large subunit [Bacilli bacterium]